MSPSKTLLFAAAVSLLSACATPQSLAPGTTLDEARAKDALVFALDRPLPRLPLGRAGPAADERRHRRERITGRGPKQPYGARA